MDATEEIMTPVVAAIEALWAKIRENHPDTPRVVFAIASDGKKYGHFAEARWNRGPEKFAEVFLSGEGLRRGAEATLGTLLHEAAHGVASARKIADTSRNGRYHNAKFRKLAEELGITVELAGAHGYSTTTVPGDTASAYGFELADLDAALAGLHRLGELTRGSGRENNNNPVACTCSCDPPRRIRVSPTTLADGAIICGICDDVFEKAS